MSYSKCILLSLFAFAVSCGRMNGSNGNNNAPGNPEGLTPPASELPVQTLTYIESIFITPTLKSDDPVADIDYLLESTVINVSGYREIILYGINYADIDALPNCKTTKGTMVVMSPFMGVDLYFGMEGNGHLLKGSSTTNISELSRHLVAGKIMTLSPGSYSSPGVSYPDGINPEVIDQSTCTGKAELKVVGVR